LKRSVSINKKKVSDILITVTATNPPLEPDANSISVSSSATNIVRIKLFLKRNEISAFLTIKYFTIEKPIIKGNKIIGTINRYKPLFLLFPHENKSIFSVGKYAKYPDKAISII
jgi:hypothetical protein